MICRVTSAGQILLTIFVLPEYQRKGVGRKIIETLEKQMPLIQAAKHY